MTSKFLRGVAYLLSLVLLLSLFSQITNGNILSSAFTVLILICVLPLSRDFLRGKMGWFPNRNQTVVLFTVWFLVVINVQRLNDERHAQHAQLALESEKKAAKDAKWRAEGASIINGIEADIVAGNPERAILNGKEWLEYGDEKIIALVKRAEEEIQSKSRLKEIATLSASLEESEGKSIEEIYDIYKRLSVLDATNRDYSAAVAELGPRVEQLRTEREKSEAEYARRMAEDKKARDEMEATKEFTEDALYACQSEVVKSAKWEGAERDWTTNGSSLVTAPNIIKVVGRDVKLANGFGAKRYVTYTCFYNTKQRTALVIAIE